MTKTYVAIQSFLKFTKIKFYENTFSRVRVILSLHTDGRRLHSHFGYKKLNILCHLHHFPLWIRSFDLFRLRRVAIVSWDVRDPFLP